MKLLIALLVWVAALAGAAELSSTVAAKYKSAYSSAGAANNGSASAAPTQSFDPSSVKAADRLSLFRTVNLAKALNTAHAHLGRNTQLDAVTIYPGYLILTVRSGGNDREVVIDANGAYSASTPAGSSRQSYFALKQLSAATPSKLVRAIEASAHVTESRLNYMVLSVSPGSGLEWQIYPLRTGAVLYYQASATARHLLAWTADGPRALG